MVNIIWLGLMSIGILVAMATGRLDQVTKAAFDGAGLAVQVAIGLIGIMTLWLGIMKLAETAGLVQLLARLLRPVTRFLFPSLPASHPVMGTIILNISANILGLSNAATPLGLSAMQELQQLNRGDKEEATEAMCTFLALNTACITLIPTTIIGVRINAGSAAPTEIVGTTIFATAVGMTVAILVDRLARAWYNRARRWR
ncbi:MAG TPA: nucleoside recognition domain-containing protein [Bacillota bacterium]|nr:nucleoside recognition domain-containing protein [Bacillota bacterium]